MFKKGQSGNPAGKPKGLRSYSTIFFEVLKKVAKKNNQPITKAEEDIIMRAYIEARQGHFNYYKDIADRIYGKPKENLDLTSKGEKILDYEQINALLHRRTEADSSGG